MNKDIEIMIELQRYWDNVLRAGDEIAKAEAAIAKLNGALEAGRKRFAGIDAEIKNLKIEIKQKEIDLAERDDKAKKLEARRNILKTEKEVSALDRELEALNSERGALEERLIALFDEVEKRQEEHKKAGAEIDALALESGDQIKNLEERIARFRNSHSENRGKFDGLSGSLTAAVSSRFMRHTQAGNGKGIAAIQGQDICGGCNFKVPAHLAQDASKNDKPVICTNCGRFIYRDV